MPTTSHPTLHIPGTTRSATTTDDLLALIQASRPLGAPPLDESRLFCWQATISSDVIDSFFTRMHTTTLQNYAADLRRGVGWLDSHDIRHLPLGRSIDGTLHGGDPATVTGTFFLVRGIAGGTGISSDDLAASIEAGIARDCSVGFSPGSFKCSICEGDPFDWFRGVCEHIPGLTYDAKGRPAERGECCYAWVMDGHLREVSSVYKGATPNAEISGVIGLAHEKAARMMSNGLMDRRLEPVLTRAFGSHLPHLDIEAELRRLDAIAARDLDLYRS